MPKNKVPYVFMGMYFSFNTLAFLYFIFGGKSSYPIIKRIQNSDMIIVFILQSFLLIGSYKFYYKFYPKFKKQRIANFKKPNQNLLGVLLIILSIVNFLFFYSNSVGAGSSDQEISGGIFGFISAIFQPNSLILIFLFYFKPNKLWYILFILNGVFNLLLGWTNFLIYYFFLFLFYLSENQVPIKKIIRFIILAMFLYPPIYFLRMFFRLRDQETASFSDINIISMFTENNSIPEFILLSYWHLIERFQQFYLSLSSFVYRSEIMDRFSSGDLIPYYAEGIHRSFVKSSFLSSQAESLGSFLPSLFYGLSYDYNWNVSPGFFSYFFVYDYSILFIPLYLIFIIIIPLKLNELFHGSKRIVFLIYINFIVLLFHGWYSQYFNFVWAFFIFILFLSIQAFFNFLLKLKI